jgi:hypothetical protein
MLIVIMLIVVMLIVIMLIVIMMIVVMLIVIMLIVIMMNVVICGMSWHPIQAVFFVKIFCFFRHKKTNIFFMIAIFLTLSGTPVKSSPVACTIKVVQS